MRLSCNGCRVLRKGCTSECPIRGCLQWIPSPQSQSNATLFLAKFYGRAGLLNLLNSTTNPSLRPSIFKSLLYDACGRIVNPIFGSSGLLSSGSWHLCHSAVQSVLQGQPISPLLHSSSDIRHVSNNNNKPLRKVANGAHFKRSGVKRKSPPKGVVAYCSGSELDGSDSSTVETAVLSPAPPPSLAGAGDDDGLQLELTMWWGQHGKGDFDGSDANTCRLTLGADD